MNEILLNIIVDGSLLAAFILGILFAVKTILAYIDEIDKHIRKLRKRN